MINNETFQIGLSKLDPEGRSLGCWRKQEENLKALLATSWPMSKLSRKACRNCWLRKAASLAERQPPWCQGKSRQEPSTQTYPWHIRAFVCLDIPRIVKSAQYGRHGAN